MNKVQPTAEQMAEIQRKSERGYPRSRIAREVGLGQCVVARVLREIGRESKPRRTHSKMTPEKLYWMGWYILAGFTASRIARELRVADRTVVDYAGMWNLHLTKGRPVKTEIGFHSFDDDLHCRNCDAVHPGTDAPVGRCYSRKAAWR